MRLRPLYVMPIRFVFLWLVVFCLDANAQTPPDSGRQQSTASATAPAVPVDVARIRKLLDEPSIRVTPVKPTPTTPTVTYQVDVFAYTPPRMPTLGDKINEGELKMPEEVAAILHDLQYLHPVNAINAARGALYRRKVAKARREVLEELRAFEAQAAKAATPTTPNKK